MTENHFCAILLMFLSINAPGACLCSAARIMDHSILDKVIAAQVSEKAQHMRMQEMLQTLLDRLHERERDVLVRRFGLYGQNELTLKDIGEQFAITRERVRQIEANGLKKLQELMRDKSVSDVVDPVVTSTIHLLEERGGVLSGEELWEIVCQRTELPTSDTVTRDAFEFVLEQLLSDRIDALPQTRDRQYGWKLHFVPLDHWQLTVDEARSLLEEHQKPMEEEHFFTKLKQRRADTEEAVIRSHIRLSKHVRKNVLGQWGLHHWNVIAPRRVNDKIYLILKKEQKPLHFNDITQRINDAGFDRKVAYPSTVHNELILDSKYILVGRGIYALSEWGYTSGVVADVIIEVLSTSNHPLDRDTIVEEVLKRRIVRKSTILLALTDRARFDRTCDGHYQLVVTPPVQTVTTTSSTSSI